ncbi:MAG: MlaD family protein [Candidatus Wallbacteria bacterium]|nr:MlaD family protein [Candidatus Wallbacteria bacterium]
MGKSYHRDEIKAGFYILTAAGALVLLLLAISHQGGVGPTKTFHADFKFINGVQEGAVVRFGGMKVGEVSKVTFSPDDCTMIRVQFKVLEEVPVKQDTIVAINAIGVMGDYYLEIIPGTKDSPVLKPGNLVASLTSPRLDELFRDMGSIAGEVKEITGALAMDLKEVLDDEAKAHIRSIVSRGDELAAKLDRLVENMNLVTGDESRLKFKEVLSNFKDFSGVLKEKSDPVMTSMEGLLSRLDKVTKDNEQQIDSMLKKMSSAMANIEDITSSRDDIKAMLADLRKSASSLEEVMSRNKGNLSDAIHNLRISSENTKDFTRKISQYPWTLIWKSRVEPDYAPKADR